MKRKGLYGAIFVLITLFPFECFGAFRNIDNIGENGWYVEMKVMIPYKESEIIKDVKKKGFFKELIMGELL